MSDKTIETAEKIQGLYHPGIYADETDKIATILRVSSPPVVDVPGEDELTRTLIAWLDGEYDKESFLFGFRFDSSEREGSRAGYQNMATGFRAGYLAALRSRLASADSIAEAIVAHGLGNADDKGRIALLIRQGNAEPVQAAPKGEGHA